MTTVLGIAGTHYCGSTMLGLCLGSHPDVFASGELARITEIGADAGCRFHGERCSFWTRDFVAACAANRSSMHAAVAARAGRMDATAVVYGDKLPFRYAGVDLDGYLILYKRPEAYVYSALTHDNADLSAALEHYADLYTTLLDHTMPTTTVAYESFASDPEATLRSLAKVMDISFDPAMLAPWDHRDRLHLLGGNSGAFAHLLPPERFEEAARSEYWKTAYSPEHVDWIRSHHREIALDEKWRDHLTPAQIQDIGANRAAQDTYHRLLAAS